MSLLRHNSDMKPSAAQTDLINALARTNGFDSGNAAAHRFGLTKKGGAPDIRFDVTAAEASTLIDALKNGLHATTKLEALAIVSGDAELGDHSLGDVLALAFGTRYRPNVYRDELTGNIDGASARVTHTIDMIWIPKKAVFQDGLAAVLERLGLGLADPRETALAKIRDLMATHRITVADLA